MTHAHAASTNQTETITYETFKAKFDGTEQQFHLRLPPGFDSAMAHDLMIGFHGHSSLGKQYMYDERGECKGARDVAAKHNMIFVAPDYRGNSWMGPAAEADMVQLIGHLKTQFKIGRVFLVGGSMGGTSVLIFTALHPDLVDGVSSQNGIASLMEYDNDFAGVSAAICTSYGGKAGESLAAYRKRKPDEFRKRSPLFVPEKFTMPVAITVGGNDTIVPPQTTLQFVDDLQKSNKNVLMINRPDGGHATNYRDTVAAAEFIIERAAKKK